MSGLLVLFKSMRPFMGCIEKIIKEVSIKA
jgi:hypothetical protein